MKPHSHTYTLKMELTVHSRVGQTTQAEHHSSRVKEQVSNTQVVVAKSRVLTGSEIKGGSMRMDTSTAQTLTVLP